MQQAQQNFVERFRENALPTDLECELETEESTGVGYVLKNARLVSSTSEAMRMIKQGAVKIDGAKVSDAKMALAGTECGNHGCVEWLKGISVGVNSES